MKFFKSIVTIALLGLLSGSSYATHLLSGEITYRDGSDGKTIINLRIQNDCINGNTSALTPTVDIGIYNAKDNKLLTTLELRKREGPKEFVQFVCPNQNRSHCSQIINYEGEIKLEADHDGYILYYYRCCRSLSNNILNAWDEGFSLISTIPAAKYHKEIGNIKLPEALVLCTGISSIPIEYDSVRYDSDSISIKFITPFSGGTRTAPTPNFLTELSWPPRNLSYQRRYSSAKPVGIYGSLNADRDSMYFNIPDEGKYYLAIQIEEWRDTVLLNTRIKDFLIHTNYCNKDTFNYAKDLRANQSEANSVLLRWNSCYKNVDDPLEYQVFRSENENMKDSILFGVKNTYDSKPNEYLNDLNVRTGKTYYYRITSANKQGKIIGYSNIDSVTILAVGSEQIKESLDINIYPNPSQNSITIKSKINLEEIRILDLSGRLIDTHSINHENLKQIYIQDLKAGIYIIEAYGNNMVFRKRFIKY